MKCHLPLKEGGCRRGDRGGEEEARQEPITREKEELRPGAQKRHWKESKGEDDPKERKKRGGPILLTKERAKKHTSGRPDRDAN